MKHLLVKNLKKAGLLSVLCALTFSSIFGIFALPEMAYAQTTGGSAASTAASGASGTAACAASGALGASSGLLGGIAGSLGGIVSSAASSLGGLFSSGGGALKDNFDASTMGDLSSFGLSGVTSIAGIGLGSVSVNSTVLNTNTGKVAGDTGYLVKKDSFLDCIFYSISRMALRAITASTLSWAANGFQGNPAFVQNPTKFFTDIADQEIGRLLYNDPSYNWMCSPFSLQIRRALILNRPFAQKSQCTLTQVVKNFQGFTSGINNQLGNLGGLIAWNDVATNPQNSPFGAYGLASFQLEASIAGSKEVNLLKLNWGNGFFSWPDQACVADVAQNISEATIRREDIDNGYTPAPEIAGPRRTSYDDCKTVTPGSVIAEQINKTLGNGQDQLVAADEVNEVISALLQGLVVNALSGSGLAGMGKSFGNTTNDYSAQLVAQDQQIFAQNKADAVVQINNLVASENAYIAIKNQTRPRIDASANLVRSLMSCYSGSASSTIATSPFNQSDMTAASSTLLSVLSIKGNLERDIAIGEVNITNLQNLGDSINTLPYDRRTQLPSLMQQLTNMFSTVHTDAAVANAEYDRDYNVPTTLDSVDQATSSRIDSCRVARNLPRGGSSDN